VDGTRLGSYPFDHVPTAQTIFKKLLLLVFFISLLEEFLIDFLPLFKNTIIIFSAQEVTDIQILNSPLYHIHCHSRQHYQFARAAEFWDYKEYKKTNTNKQILNSHFHSSTITASNNVFSTRWHDPLQPKANAIWDTLFA
jgi:hypothetical protein